MARRTMRTHLLALVALLACGVFAQTASAASVSMSAPADNSYDADGSVTFSGTATAGAGDVTVTVYQGTTAGPIVETFTTTPDGLGNWSATRPYVAGTYEATAVYSLTLAPETPTFTVDLTDPTAEFIIAPVANGAGWHKATPSVYINTFDANHEPPPTGVVCTENGNPMAVSTEDHSYEPAFKYLVAIPGGDGVYALQCTVTDKAGRSAVANTTVRVDSVAPVVGVEFTPAANANGWHNTAPSVFVTATDPNFDPAATTCKANAHDAPVATGTDLDPGAGYKFAVTVPSYDATWNIVCTAEDLADNSGSGNTTYKVDATPPVIDITFPTLNGNYSIDSTKPHPASYSCSDPVVNGTSSGLTLGTCTGPVANGAEIDRGSVGAKNFIVNATDLAGNVAQVNNTYTVGTFSDIVAAHSPSGYYRLGETSGDVLVDASGNGFHGQYKNRQESGPEGISGDNDFARAFFGEDGYGFVNGLPTSINYTLGGFFKFDDLLEQAMLHKGSSGAMWLAGGKFHFRAVDWNADTELVSTTTANTTDWYHVVGRVGEGRIELWVNGMKEAERRGQGPTDSSSSTFYIGFGAQPMPVTRAFHGLIDEVALFQSGLQGTAISEIFRADPPPKNRRKPGDSGGTADPGSGGDSGTPETEAPGGDAETPEPIAKPSVLGLWRRANDSLIRIKKQNKGYVGKAAGRKRCKSVIELNAKLRGTLTEATRKGGRCKTKEFKVTAKLSKDGQRLALNKKRRGKKSKETLTRS